MQPALGYGSTYQSFGDPVLRYRCNLQTGEEEKHIPRIGRDEGGDAPIGQDGKNEVPGRNGLQCLRSCSGGLRERVMKLQIEHQHA